MVRGGDGGPGRSVWPDTEGRGQPASGRQAEDRRVFELHRRLRRFLRKSIGGFYRMDHIYEVCKEFRSLYEGKFSILEFGVADGYSFTKKLYATRYFGMEDRVMVHGFDTFEGLPEIHDPKDRALVTGE